TKKKCHDLLQPSWDFGEASKRKDLLISVIDEGLKDPLQVQLCVDPRVVFRDSFLQELSQAILRFGYVEDFIPPPSITQIQSIDSAILQVLALFTHHFFFFFVGWTLASPMESDKYKIEIMSAMELKEKELNEDKDDEKYESQKISLKSLQVEAGKSTAQINFQEVMPKMWPISLSWTFQCQARVVTQAAFSAWSQSKSLSIAISYSPTFTNLGATGRNGPTSLNTYYANQCHEKHVTLQNGIQMWTVPCTGKYKIIAYGARGGDNNSYRKHGGYGTK
ncbi:hypothetical protein RFI_37707, partial [Reticulomyxa filosa]